MLRISVVHCIAFLVRCFNAHAVTVYHSWWRIAQSYVCFICNFTILHNTNNLHSKKYILFGFSSFFGWVCRWYFYSVMLYVGVRICYFVHIKIHILCIYCNSTENKHTLLHILCAKANKWHFSNYYYIWRWVVEESMFWFLMMCNGRFYGAIISSHAKL